jgi:hypothetical protein
MSGQAGSGIRGCLLICSLGLAQSGTDTRAATQGRTGGQPEGGRPGAERADEAHERLPRAPSASESARAPPRAAPRRTAKRGGRAARRTQDAPGVPMQPHKAHSAGKTRGGVGSPGLHMPCAGQPGRGVAAAHPEEGDGARDEGNEDDIRGAVQQARGQRGQVDAALGKAVLDHVQHLPHARQRE